MEGEEKTREWKAMGRRDRKEKRKKRRERGREERTERSGRGSRGEGSSEVHKDGKEVWKGKVRGKQRACKYEAVVFRSKFQPTRDDKPPK